jgi:hypothetical protein
VPNLAALAPAPLLDPRARRRLRAQGLTSSGAFLYVSSYKPTPDLKANTGPRRVFGIEKASGRITGGFDIPPSPARTRAGSPMRATASCSWPTRDPHADPSHHYDWVVGDESLDHRVDESKNDRCP